MNFITLKNDQEQIELIKALASKDPVKASQARMAFAAAVGPLIQEVINFAPGFANMYRRLPFREGDNPEIQLDLYWDIKETEYLRVWSQKIAGGLPTNEVPGGETLKFTTYRLESAISILSKFAKSGSIDAVQAGLNRMAQEFLSKKDLNAAFVALTALAQAETFDGISDKKHVIRTNTAREIVLDDFLAVEELSSRVLSAWNGGTPANRAVGMGVTDMVFSPEGIRKLKGISFNPVNTKGTLTNIPAQESLREKLYTAGGNLDFYGVNILKDNFLGVGRQYNTLFSSAAGSTLYPGYGASGTAAFNANTEEIAFGANLAAVGLLSPVVTDSDTGAEVTVMPDDQWNARSKKIGFSAEVENGFIQADARTTFSLVF
jgi:hypothetical protein